MREFAVPAAVPGAADRGSLADLVVDNATEAPDKVLFRRKDDTGAWRDVTCRAFADEVAAVAKGLVAAGVQPGDRVGLLSRTRYEWTLLDFAMWSAAAVPVPLYETSSREQVEWILADSGAVGCLVESTSHRETVDSCRPALPSLREVWTFDDGGVAKLVEMGSGVSDGELDRRRAELEPADLASLIYTSGTTGRPKGCELTHGNFLVELRNAVEILAPLFKGEPGEDDAATLLFLPLAHVFARVVEVGCVMARATLGHTADPKQLVDDLATFRPTFLLSVPRVFEKVYNGAEQKADAGGKGRIFRAAAATAVDFSRAQDTGGAGLPLRLRHALFDRLVYGRLREVLGGRLRYAVSGGAPLGERLGHFYRGLGLTVLEGYGLTETTAATAVNTPDRVRIGTVGQPLPGSSARIADDGEILVRGGHVFRGYWDAPDATAEVMDDGWFRTGDLGELDADGFLRITGRKKEILVTAAGKNVAPAMIEDRIRASRLVSQCLVVGDGKPYVAALVTLDPEALPAWLEQRGRPSDTPVDALVDDAAVRAEVQAAVDEANAAVSRAEGVKRFRILPVDLTEAGGHLTPSLKVKRAVVMAEFRDDLDALYA